MWTEAVPGTQALLASVTALIVFNEHGCAPTLGEVESGHRTESASGVCASLIFARQWFIEHLLCARPRRRHVELTPFNPHRSPLK